MLRCFAQNILGEYSATSPPSHLPSCRVHARVFSAPATSAAAKVESERTLGNPKSPLRGELTALHQERRSAVRAQVDLLQQRQKEQEEQVFEFRRQQQIHDYAQLKAAASRAAQEATPRRRVGGRRHQSFDALDHSPLPRKVVNQSPARAVEPPAQERVPRPSSPQRRQYRSMSTANVSASLDVAYGAPLHASRPGLGATPQAPRSPRSPPSFAPSVAARPVSPSAQGLLDRTSYILAAGDLRRGSSPRRSPSPGLGSRVYSSGSVLGRTAAPPASPSRRAAEAGAFRGRGADTGGPYSRSSAGAHRSSSTAAPQRAASLALASSAPRSASPAPRSALVHSGAPRAPPSKESGFTSHYANLRRSLQPPAAVSASSPASASSANITGGSESTIGKFILQRVQGHVERGQQEQYLTHYRQEFQQHALIQAQQMQTPPPPPPPPRAPMAGTASGLASGITPAAPGAPAIPRRAPSPAMAEALAALEKVREAFAAPAATGKFAVPPPPPPRAAVRQPAPQPAPQLEQAPHLQRFGAAAGARGRSLSPSRFPGASSPSPPSPKPSRFAAQSARAPPPVPHFRAAARSESSEHGEAEDKGGGAAPEPEPDWAADGVKGAGGGFSIHAREYEDKGGGVEGGVDDNGDKGGPALPIHRAASPCGDDDTASGPAPVTDSVRDSGGGAMLERARDSSHGGTKTGTMECAVEDHRPAASEEDKGGGWADEGNDKGGGWDDEENDKGGGWADEGNDKGGGWDDGDKDKGVGDWDDEEKSGGHDNGGVEESGAEAGAPRSFVQLWLESDSTAPQHAAASDVSEDDDFTGDDKTGHLVSSPDARGRAARSMGGRLRRATPSPGAKRRHAR